MRDEIYICELEIHCRIGVTAAERAQPQRLSLDVTMEPLVWFSALGDDIRKTVDYHAVAVRISTWVKDREYNLLETLAEEIAGLILGEFAVMRVQVELRKFVLPGVRHVGVRLARER